MQVNLARKEAHLVYDPGTVSVAGVVEAVERVGYSVGRAELRVHIAGMYCASCVARIEDALKAIPGVLEANVNPATGVATVKYVPGTAEFRAIQAAVESVGYQTAHPIDSLRPPTRKPRPTPGSTGA